MSLEVGGVPRDATAQLRALAHPVRLRILSLLTGASLTAAEIARELALTHANASYHLRQLLAGGIIDVAGEERIRGGVAKRYRYDVERDLTPAPADLSPGARPTAEHRLALTALAAELRRRSDSMRRVPGNRVVDAELWVDPQTWRDVCERVGEAAADLHRAAVAPRTEGAVRTSATIALFEMEPGA
jgi:DNA-binding transcriptional ArsR family regulator